jgi:hypothetical protein
LNKLSNIKRRGKKPYNSIKLQAKHEIPKSVDALLQKIGIIETSHQGSVPPKDSGVSSSSTIKHLVRHIFECLRALEHIIKSKQSFSDENEEVEKKKEVEKEKEVEAGEQVEEADPELLSPQSAGLLLHELVHLSSLVGDTGIL